MCWIDSHVIYQCMWLNSEHLLATNKSYKYHYQLKTFVELSNTPTTMCHLITYVCVYYNGQICNSNEGTTFISNNIKTFMVNKVITLTQLLELVHQKINIEPHQHIQHLHFRCPIFKLGQPYMYTYFILGEDPDVWKMFNIFYNNPTLSFVELFATICDNNNPPNNQHDSTSNVKDLLYEYESCWVKDHDSDSNSPSKLEGCNMSPSYKPIFKWSYKYEDDSC